MISKEHQHVLISIDDLRPANELGSAQTWLNSIREAYIIAQARSVRLDFERKSLAVRLGSAHGNTWLGSAPLTSRAQQSSYNRT